MLTSKDLVYEIEKIEKVIKEQEYANPIEGAKLKGKVLELKLLLNVRQNQVIMIKLMELMVKYLENKPVSSYKSELVTVIEEGGK